MTRLILVNGPPGVGKSTLAALFAERHPLTLNLDVDVIRGLLGAWRADPHTAGLRARAIALAAARTHLAAGHDVVVPQFLFRTTFIDQLEELAAESGAEWHEIVLMDTRSNAIRRGTTEPEPVLASLYDELQVLLAERDPVVITSREGQVEATYREFSAAVAYRERHQ